MSVPIEILTVELDKIQSYILQLEEGNLKKLLEIQQEQIQNAINKLKQDD